MGYKQVIVVRRDLKMGKGKIAAQVAHASLLSFLEAWKKHPKLTETWLREGGKKVVLRVDSLEELLKIKDEARKMGIPHALVVDAGYTQVPPGSITALGIGPWEEEEIDKITGHLKLL